MENLIECQCCLEKRDAAKFFKNKRSRTGEYCEKCASVQMESYLIREEYFEEMRIKRVKARRLARLAAILKSGGGTCKYCKEFKIFSEMIANSSKLGGISDRCKRCDKEIVKPLQRLRYKDLKKYHKDYMKAYREAGKFKAVSERKYKKDTTQITEAYARNICRLKLSYKGIKIKRSEIPEKLVLAQQAAIVFKRAARITSTKY